MKTTTAALAFTAVALAAAEGPAKIEARATATSAAASGSGSALPTVTTKGNAFFAGEDRFYIKGVDYQPGGSSNLVDPLADTSICGRDIPEFQKLGLNTIRVYTIDNSADHSACMSQLADAGIYLALDVNTPLYSLNRQEPQVSYNAEYLQSVFATIDEFAGYSNTLLFFSGNEVLNDTQASTEAAPYVKAVTRDMKQYIGERGYRSIPVGYSAADVSTNQYLMAQYMDCGDDASRSDFYSINNYEWCDPSSFEQSGWDTLVDTYKNYSQPLFMSEYGCITNTRTFAETTALYQPDMIGVFSGGLVYEYAQEANMYGLVNINGDSVSPVGDQFSDLESALAGVSSNLGDGGYSTNNGQQECPSSSDEWDISPFSGSALPAMPSGADKYMQNGAGKGPGLSGSGSQEAGTTDIATAASGAGSVTATYGSGSTAGATGSSSTSSQAAASLRIPASNSLPVLVSGMVVALSFGMGALLL